MPALRWRTAALLAAALVACASVAAAARTPADLARRSLLAADDEGWRSVTVLNHCPYRVAMRAGFTIIPKVDKGHACPHKQPGGECTTDWVFLEPGMTTVLEGLPESLWSYTAYVAGESPRHYLSKSSLGAWLAASNDHGRYCQNEDNDACVWWDLPAVVGDGAGGLVAVLSCDDLRIGALSVEQQLAEISVVNDCDEAVQFKLAYELPVGDDGTNCTDHKWLGKENTCLTGWLELGPGEGMVVGQTPSAYFQWGAHLAANTTYDLAQRASGARQRWNDTTACPESDAYGSGYTCEWWAPNTQGKLDINSVEPLVLTCDS